MIIIYIIFFNRLILLLKKNIFNSNSFNLHIIANIRIKIYLPRIIKIIIINNILNLITTILVIVIIDSLIGFYYILFYFNLITLLG